MKQLLTFGRGNRKLDRFTDTLSLPSGYTCPGALLCKSMADRITGKITDGPDCQFRCFSASDECIRPVVRKSRWNNFELLKKCKTTKQMVDLIMASLPKNPIKVRPGVAGDFFNQMYFDAWMQVARLNPKTLFYAYTKSINYWVKRLDSIPENFVLTASYGGKYDHLIRQHNLKYGMVVYSAAEAKAFGLEIDHDDSLASNPEVEKFALLLHNTQPAGSEACKAYVQLKKLGISGYGNDKVKKMGLK